MSDPLKDDIRAYYEAQQLPDSAVNEILERGRCDRSIVQWRARAAVAGIAAVVMVSMLLLLIGQSPDESSRSLLAQEIATSHLSHFPSEFDILAEELSELDGLMTELDFELVGSRVKARFDVGGARYCKVDGGVACALTVKDRVTGAEGSLFIARLTEGLAQIPAGSIAADRAEVEFWRDNERFYSFVTTSV